MTEASERVLTQNILHVRGTLQQEFNRLQLDKKDEIYFLEQLRRSSGEGKATPKKAHSTCHGGARLSCKGAQDEQERSS